MNTLHFNTFTCAPKIAGKVVRVVRGREKPEVGGPLQGDYGATMEKLWSDYGWTIVMGWRTRLEKRREEGAEGIGR